MPSAVPTHGVAFSDALRVWWRIALLSFGGPAGQIALMHRILVEEKRWIGEQRFLHALNYCMLLPGPEAQQLATYIGWLLHGVRGGVVAGVLFVLPGALAMLVLSLLYVSLGRLDAVEGLLFGLKAAVLAIVLQALLRLAGRALKSVTARGLALGAFVAIFAFDVGFPFIVLSAALLGWALHRFGGAGLSSPAHGATSADLECYSDADSALGSALPAHARGHRTLWVAAGFALLWALPVLALLALLGPNDVFSRIALFFSQTAVVTFGGAYAVLAYVAQAAVEHYGWLQPGEMLDGLGLAETTPGPLILVLQFVGFLAAFRDPGLLSPWLAGSLGAALTAWVSFAPCFLWIFLGAPYIERLRANRGLSAALAAVTAAVVGVIANLGAWFALHTLFKRVDTLELGPLQLAWPDPATLDPAALVLCVLAVLAALRWRIGVFSLIGGCAALGLGYRLLLG